MSATSTRPPERPEGDERLGTVQAFRRFVARVTPSARRWLERWDVPPDEHEDLLQELLLQTYKKRDAYDPERGRHEDWAYGFLGHVLRHHRRGRARRRRRFEVTSVDLLDVAGDSPGPDEDTERARMRLLLEKCLETLDGDEEAILLARAVDGIPMKEVAAAHGISVSTAYVFYNDARERMARALDGEQDRRRALGVAVLPITLDQLIASDGRPPEVPAETLRHLSRKLERVMADDLATGKLRDEGAEVTVPRSAPARPATRVVRALLGRRGLPVLTFVAGAAGGGLAMHALLKDTAGRHQADVDAVAIARSEPVDGAAPREAVDAAAEPGPETSPVSALADARVPERLDSGAGPAEDDLAEEQALFDKGSSAYQNGSYAEAVTLLQAHAGKHPRGRYAEQREKLLTLALFRAGRASEARGRLAQLRRANPSSPLVRELTAALSTP